MTALILFRGAFLPITASVVVLVLCAPSIWRVLTEAPAEDVLTPCERFERQRAALGEASEKR